jgi:hypothetical protein
MLSGEMLTRYDGWFAACAVAIVLLVYFGVRTVTDRERRQLDGTRTWVVGNPKWKATFLRFAVLIALVPIFWFTYNYRLYGNPLEFATGPYSAKAIAERTTRAGDPPYPGKDHPATAALYFVKSAALNLGGQRLEGEYGHWWRKNWPQDGWYFVLLAGTVAMLMLRRWALALLWIPLPFYALSIAHGGVPVFIPSWWPFSYYNVRYGLQLLPAAAVCAGMLVARARSRKAVTVIVLLFATATYIGDWRTDPICLREAKVNSRAREELETKLSEALAQLPPESSIFMSTGEHVGALERAGVALKRTINENNYYAWQLATSSPQTMADYAVAFDEDAVAKAVRTNPHFERAETLVVNGQAPATLYRRISR